LTVPGEAEVIWLWHKARRRDMAVPWQGGVTPCRGQSARDRWYGQAEMALFLHLRNTPLALFGRLYGLYEIERAV
jgi:hypothetical protein